MVDALLNLQLAGGVLRSQEILDDLFPIPFEAGKRLPHLVVGQRQLLLERLQLAGRAGRANRVQQLALRGRVLQAEMVTSL